MRCLDVEADLNLKKKYFVLKEVRVDNSWNFLEERSELSRTPLLGASQ